MSNVDGEDNLAMIPPLPSDLNGETLQDTDSVNASANGMPSTDQTGNFSPLGFGNNTAMSTPSGSNSHVPYFTPTTADHSAFAAQYQQMGADQSRYNVYPPAMPQQQQQQQHHHQLHQEPVFNQFQSSQLGMCPSSWSVGIQQQSLPNANSMPTHFNAMGVVRQQGGDRAQNHLPHYSGLHTPVHLWGHSATLQHPTNEPPVNTLQPFPPAPNQTLTTSINPNAPFHPQDYRGDVTMSQQVSKCVTRSTGRVPSTATIERDRVTEPTGSLNDFTRFPWLRTILPTTGNTTGTRFSRVTTKEWAKSIVDQEWEIYWSPDGDCPSKQSNHAKTFTAVMDDDDVPVSDLVKQIQGALKEDDNDSDDLEVEEPDWYYGTVHSLCPPSSVADSAMKSSFKVTFAGEATEYTMALTPDMVRPSSRVWAQRTKAILMQPNGEKEGNNKAWESSLPVDTKSIYDSDVLNRVQEITLSDFPVTEAVTFRQSDQTEANVETLQALQQEHAECCRLMLLVRFQLFLRSRLAPIEPRDVTEVDSDSDPTESSINLMVEHLLDLDKACQWHFLCWRLIHRLFAVDRTNQQQTPLPKDMLLEKALNEGRQTLTKMLSIGNASHPSDSTKSASTGQKRPCVVTSTALRAMKRQRALRGVPECWIQSSESERTAPEDEGSCHEDLFSAETISLFVENVRQLDRRWYTQHFGNMLNVVSSMVVTSFISWEQKAQICLGDKMKRQLQTSLAKSLDSSGDLNDRGKLAPNDSPGGPSRESGYVKYEDIESLIDAANHDRPLKSFALSNYVNRLVNKLASIDSFEARAWDIISVVMNEPVEELNEDVDSTLRDLKALLEEARTQGGAIENMISIGREKSRLSREAINNAILCRVWLLEFKHAEILRERVDFLQGIVSRFPKLPPLVSKSGLIDQKLNQLSGRVADVAAKYRGHDFSLSSNLQLRLLDRSRQNDHNHLLSLKGAKTELDNLRKLPALTPAEEMLAIRCDVLSWAEKADHILALPKPPFSEVHLLNTDVSRIRLGDSSMLLAVRQGVRTNAIAEADILVFAKDDVNIISGPSYSRIGSLQAPAAAWKERADGALSVLTAYENPHTGESHTLGGMLELRCIDDLLNEYPGLNVDISCSHARLDSIRTKAMEWSTSINDCLSNESSTFDETFTEVDRLRPNLPVGIIIEPSKQAFLALCELLAWYRAIKRDLCNDSVNKATLESSVAYGFEVIDLFNMQRGSQETMPQLATPRSNATQPISVANLNNSWLIRKYMTRMTNESYDISEGSPLFFILYAAWALTVDDFVQRCLDSTMTTLSRRSDVSLSRAKTLQRSRPTPTPPSANDKKNEVKVKYLKLELFNAMIQSGERAETSARAAISASEPILLGDCLQTVNSQYAVLEELCFEFQKRRTSFGDIVLDDDLEKDLDRNRTTFGWLVLASSQKALQSRSNLVSQFGSVALGSDRLPWETLQLLHDGITLQLTSSGFSSFVERVKELYASAFQWQGDVSKLCTYTDAPLASSNCGDTLIDVISGLLNHSILLTVALPREQEIRAVLSSTLNFEISLRHLLAEEYAGDNLDRASVPDDDSMVAYDGTFHLYRLTSSPMFNELRTAMVQTREIISAPISNTPGLKVFRWIEKICGWIDSIHTLVAKHSAGSTVLHLPVKEAEDLTLLGNQILNASEDVLLTLASYNIHLSVNPFGDRVATLAPGGKEYSCGFACIRWSLFLLNALKSDVTSQKEWESRWTEHMSIFEAIKAYANGKHMNHPTVLQKLYEFREDHAAFYLEGLDMFACPMMAELDKSKMLIEFIDKHLQTFSTPDAAKAFAMSRYRDPHVIAENRFDLLASLVDRGLASKEELGSTLIEESKNGNIRVGARSLLATALKKAADTLVLDESEKLDSFCAVKAWEIENSLFELFGGEVESKKPQEYVRKARSLKRSIEDPGNASLFLRVACGIVTPDDLVNMSIDELANPTVQRDRRKATEAAHEAYVLTKSVKSDPSVATARAKPRDQVVQEFPQVESVHRLSTLKTSEKSIRLPSSEESAGVADSSSIKAANAVSTPTSVATLKSPPALGSSAVAASTLRTSSKFGEMVKSARASGPPPPPPALVMTMKPAARTFKTSDESDSITNSNGGDRFHFSLADGKYSFFATLHIEKDPLNNVNGILPPTWNQKGRLAGAALSKFFKDKLNGGRREPIILRVTAMTDKDTREHKKFCKEYEGILGRITMFEFEEREKEKAYLVTPKFHRDAWGLTFDRPMSSYLVYLSRKI